MTKTCVAGVRHLGEPQSGSLQKVAVLVQGSLSPTGADEHVEV